MHINLRISILMVLLLNISTNLFSQQLGCWNTFNVAYDNGNKWSFSTEAQLRSLDFYRNYNYHEFKGMIGYKFIPNLQTALILGRYTTYGEGKSFQNPKLADEFRVAVQLGLKNSIGKVQIDHRYRIEKRYYYSGARGFRIRYRVGLSVPLDPAKKTSLGLSNEFLLAITSGSSIIRYDKNRITLGLTRKLNNMVSMQLGYLSQYDSKSADEPGNSFLVYSLLLNLSNLNIDRNHHTEN